MYTNLEELRYALSYYKGTLPELISEDELENFLQGMYEFKQKILTTYAKDTVHC